MLKWVVHVGFYVGDYTWPTNHWEQCQEMGFDDLDDALAFAEAMEELSFQVWMGGEVRSIQIRPHPAEPREEPCPECGKRKPCWMPAPGTQERGRFWTRHARFCRDGEEPRHPAGNWRFCEISRTWQPEPQASLEMFR